MIKILNQKWHKLQINELDGIIGKQGTRVVFGLISDIPSAIINIPENINIGDMKNIDDPETSYDVYSYGLVDESYNQLLSELNYIGLTNNEETKLRIKINQRVALGNTYLREILKQNDLYEVIPHDQLGDIIIYADPSLKQASNAYTKKENVI